MEFNISEEDFIRGNALGEWERSDAAKILDEGIIDMVNKEIKALADDIVKDPPENGHLSELSTSRLQNIFVEKPYVVYEFGGERKFTTVATYFQWRALLMNFAAYCHRAAAYAKSLDSFEAARHFLIAANPIDNRIAKSSYFLKPLSEEETESSLSELAQGENELAVMIEYKQHPTLEQIRAELAKK